MPCDTWQSYAGQLKSERVAEVKKIVTRIEQEIAAGRARVKVGPQGAIVFEGIDGIRNGVRDACVYRRILASPTGAFARMKIAQAEQQAGRGVSKQALAQGVHSHDGGATWHDHKG